MRPALGVAGWVVAASCATVGLAVLFLHVGSVAVMAAVLVALVAALLVPLKTLPALMLVGFALAPLQYLSIPSRHGAISPASILAFIFVARCVIRARPVAMDWRVLPVALLSAWVLGSNLMSPFPATSAGWTVNFLLLVAAPAFLLPGWREAQRAVERAWLWLGAVLGAYAVTELVLRQNVFLGSAYENGPEHLGQNWGTYRVTTTLGHPLTNGTFFAVAALFGLGRVFRGDRRRSTMLATALSFVGALGSGSRGPLLGLLLGMVLLIALSAGRVRELSRTARQGVGAFMALTLCIAGLGLASTIQSRGVEGADSTATRVETFDGGRRLIEQYWPWGAGPGLTDQLKRSLPTGDSRRGVESSAMQLVISLGLPGLLLSAWTLIAAGLSAVRVRPELAACILAYVVAAAGYNLLETNRPALLLWGLLMGVAVRCDGAPTGAAGVAYSDRSRQLETAN